MNKICIIFHLIFIMYGQSYILELLITLQSQAYLTLQSQYYFQIIHAKGFNKLSYLYIKYRRGLIKRRLGDTWRLGED
jgi:hypothetical protein